MSNLREDFLEFVPMVRTTGEALANSIISFLKTKKVDTQYIRGQGFDGASAMSGIHLGVQKRICEALGKEAVYVHCSSHSLNLALSDSCSIPAIRNTLGTINEVINFVTKSAIRLNILKNTIHNKYSNAPSSYKLLKYCETRFIQRHESVFRFVELFECVVNTLGIIEVDGDAKSASKANMYLKAIMESTFIVAMFVLEEILSSTAKVSKYFQDPQCDLAAALNYIDTCVLCLNDWRLNASINFAKRYKKAEAVTLQNDLQISTPGIAARQKNRSNILAANPEEYFRMNVYIPFLDHILMNLKERFDKHRNIITGLQGVVPKYMKDDCSFHEILSLYEADMSESRNAVEVEIKMWMNTWKNVAKDEKPGNALSAYIECNEIMFPNVKKLLKILATIPVSTCTPERSFSTLRRLKTYLRNSTSQNRLNGLALMSVHREVNISSDLILDSFANKKCRRLNIIL